MLPLNDGESLKKVSRYQLERGYFALRIDVISTLAGPGAGDVVACPLCHNEDFHVSAALLGTIRAAPGKLIALGNNKP